MKRLLGDIKSHIINISPENIEKRLDYIVEQIREKELPDSFLITPNTRPENLVELLAQREFNRMG